MHQKGTFVPAAGSPWNQKPKRGVGLRLTLFTCARESAPAASTGEPPSQAQAARVERYSGVQ